MDKLGPMARAAHDCGLVLAAIAGRDPADPSSLERGFRYPVSGGPRRRWRIAVPQGATDGIQAERSEEHTSELQSQSNLVCRLLLEKKKINVSCTTPVAETSLRSSRSLSSSTA